MVNHGPLDIMQNIHHCSISRMYEHLLMIKLKNEIYCKSFNYSIIHLYQTVIPIIGIDMSIFSMIVSFLSFVACFSSIAPYPIYRGYWSTRQFKLNGNCIHVYKTISGELKPLTMASKEPIVDSPLDDLIFIGNATEWVRNVGSCKKMRLRYWK